MKVRIKHRSMKSRLKLLWNAVKAVYTGVIVIDYDVTP
jgi:hypothetical protein